MSDTLARLLKRALWFEALHETYPNRFTLWLWKRAVERLRSERDHPRRPRSPCRAAAYGYMGAVGDIMSGVAQAKAAKASAAAAQAQYAAYQQSLYNSGLQNASQSSLSQYANLLGYGSTNGLLNNAFQNRN